ncbi:hypothetical protein [Sinisalibacter lacisalsi]|uniref:DUF86 domain-containing protein n=1 Tax=Sinisalibacter lacisalsi TaxID=1526570 RepID=A0ABQ1QLG8_9RHOB|nr:hypothetical protein [Sinisalibacter lacisalsi]GGD29399.1 hypothetical protein GCM10011358_11750 [Sinisalibacter lacisalsi]
MGGNNSSVADVRRTIREVTAYAEFVELAPYPDDAEEAWGIGDRRDVLCEALLAYSLLAIRRLDDFLKSRRQKDDDIIAPDLEIDLEYVLGDEGALLSEETRDLVNKSAAHLTNRGLVETWDREMDLGALLEEKMNVFERLTTELDAISGKEIEC